MTPHDIKTLRARLSLTQSQLASVLGIHAITLARWESKTTRSPIPAHQQGLLRHFQRAAARCDGKELAALISQSGPIAALRTLLNLSFEGKTP